MALAAVLFLATACADQYEGPLPVGSVAGPWACGHVAGLGRLPEHPTQTASTGIQVSWVLRCTSTGAERADGPAFALLRALTEPTVSSSELDCPIDGPVPPFYLALITSAGRVIVPFVPVDRCTHVKPDLVAALAQLHFHRIATS